MKKIILILILFLTSKVWGQYSGITYFPGEQSFMLSMENLDTKGFGIHAGGGYNMWMVSAPIGQMNPSPYLNRFGINYGILKNGLVIGTGVKFNTLPNTNEKIKPEVWVKFHPLKMVTQKRNQWDIAIAYSVSNEKYWGFGLAIPLQYRHSYLF